jgi:hypothetical protein
MNLRVLGEIYLDASDLVIGQPFGVRKRRKCVHKFVIVVKNFIGLAEAKKYPGQM